MTQLGLFDDLLPPLSTEEFSALEADIKENGVLHPVFIDEDGNVLDGRHRLKIDPNAPRKVIKGLTPAEKEAFVFRCNFVRRNLSLDQKAEARIKMQKTAKKLREEDHKKWTQEKIAKALGVTQKCVSKWFVQTIPNTTRSIRNDENDHHENKPAAEPKLDAKTKVPPAAKPIIAERVAKGETQEQVAADHGVSQSQVSKIVASEKKRAEAEAEIQKAADAAADLDISQLADVRHCSMEELLPSLSGLDAIITDPPYPEEFKPLYPKLAALAAKALKPNGILAVMCGQSYLPEILSGMADKIPYRWTVAYLTPGGQSPQIFPRKINTFWKPVILFGGSPDWIGDVIKSDVNDNDKRFHGWGQSESGMLRLVESLTHPGQTVCDPFLGGGTTAIVCLQSKRKFIGCDINADAIQKTEKRIRAFGGSQR